MKKTIGENIADAIKLSKKTHKEIANEIGLSREAVSRYFRQEITPSLHVFAKLCEALDESADDLLNLKK